MQLTRRAFNSSRRFWARLRWMSTDDTFAREEQFHAAEAESVLDVSRTWPSQSRQGAPGEAPSAEVQQKRAVLIAKPATMPVVENESEVDREIRAHNSSMYSLTGQDIIGKVISISHRHVLVDLGWKDYQKFIKSELTLSQVYRGNATGDTKRREAKIHAGDELRFRIEEVGTPHGEIFVSTQKMRADVRKRLVWDELLYAHKHGHNVRGRVLNPANAGYAVGIAGFVAFCPLHRMNISTANCIGVLKDFVIFQMSEKVGQNLVVLDPSASSIMRKSSYRPRRFNQMF